MTRSWRVSAVAACSMLLVLWAWAWSWPADPNGQVSRWLLPAALSVPLLPCLVGFALRRPRAALWSGIVALFYFCHGIAEFRVSRSPWMALEIALALVLVLAAGWPGLAAKLAKRRTAPPPNV